MSSRYPQTRTCALSQHTREGREAPLHVVICTRLLPRPRWLDPLLPLGQTRSLDHHELQRPYSWPGCHPSLTLRSCPHKEDRPADACLWALLRG